MMALMASRKRLVIGNWKKYIESADAALELAKGLKRKTRGLAGVDVAVAPPMPFVAAVAKTLESSPIKVGAQAVSGTEGAPHTGEASAAMLKSIGVNFAIVGHSERRAMGETNDSVHRQLVEAASAGLMPVLCVGELEHNAEGAHFSFIEEQLRSALAGAQSLAGKLVVAYEPVWAIGKRADQAPSAATVREMAIFIRKTLAEVLSRQAALKVPVLYGGAVEAENAPTLITDGDVAGFLVGHASVDLDQFVSIVKAASKSS